MTPGATSGNLVVHVTHTQLQIFGGLISFPLNNYNQQVEQLVNAKLNGMLSGKFTIARAAIGPDTHVSCAARDSLVLSGTTTLS